jgi:hypothetical protein
VKIIDINLEILKSVIFELKSIKDDLVFLGGATISLFITEPHNVTIRETFDVDCVVDVIHRTAYDDISKKLRLIGFNEDMESSVTCRFKKGSLILDLMPIDEKILGFSNIWYKDGFENAIKVKVGSIDIKVFSLPFLIATKIEAFKGRGKGQYISSHDIEDIVTLFDGRSTIAMDMKMSNKKVQDYLRAEFKKLLSDQNFQNSLEAHISDRQNLVGRKQIIIDRMNAFIKGNH